MDLTVGTKKRRPDMKLLDKDQQFIFNFREAYKSRIVTYKEETGGRFTQMKAAKEIGKIDQSFVGRILRGKRVPRLKTNFDAAIAWIMLQNKDSHRH
jgi:hypothetical protein